MNYLLVLICNFHCVIAVPLCWPFMELMWGLYLLVQFLQGKYMLNIMAMRCGLKCILSIVIIKNWQHCHLFMFCFSLWIYRYQLSIQFWIKKKIKIQTIHKKLYLIKKEQNHRDCFYTAWQDIVTIWVFHTS